MIVAHSLDEWRARLGTGPGATRTVVTIGNFDGVHRGHQEIVHSIGKEARRTGTLATVVTFHPHPLRVLRPSAAPPMLMSLAERLQAMEELDLDAALVLRFDLEFSYLSAREFTESVLADTLHARAILLGETFRFGHNQLGDIRLLNEMGRALDFEVVPVRPVEFRGAIISSTAIRQALRDGAVSRAARMLGRPYQLNGEVRLGTGMGRKLVVPTLNLATAAEILPANGVYATETQVRGAWHRSVTNVGMRPTFGALGISIESHLFDFSEMITAGSLAVRFCSRLRDERKFHSPEALRAQIVLDSARAKRLFRLLDGA